MKQLSFAPYLVLSFLTIVFLGGCSNLNNVAAEQKFSKIAMDYKRAEADYIEKYKVASDAERSKLQYPNVEYCGKMVKLASDYPSAPAAEDAVLWVMQNGNSTSEYGYKALEIATQRYTPSQKIGKMCEIVGMTEDKRSQEFLSKVVKTNPDKKMRGLAIICLARSTCGGIVPTPKPKLQQDKIDEAAAKLFRSAIADYGDEKYLNSDKTIRFVAEKNLFEIEHLTVGKPAPEIEGKDINGKILKLSNFRGRIAMVDFFGDW